MGARLVKFDFVPKENEQIEAVVRIPEEKRSVIHGVVKDWRNKLIKDAVVKLFEVIGTGNSCTLKPITHTFTDEYGQFLFGPLQAHKKYAIKVWFDDITVRELVVTPDDDNHNDKDSEDYLNDEFGSRPADKREIPHENIRERRLDRRSFREDIDDEH